ncbi:MAG: glucuronate isomerase [Verrucomicrobiota bacterium]
MKPFLHDDFLLSNDTAAELYHEHAAKMPVFDYHCHLPPEDIAGNKQFENLTQIWLAGDHYKWRAMRANGVPERFCTGNASDWEKFEAFAGTVPYTLRNPLYHWTHLELRRFFGIETILNADTAREVWDAANEKLASPEMTTHGLLERSRVAVVCTTDDPADTLESHRSIAEEGKLTTRVYPTFRPDQATQLGDIGAWNHWVDRLEELSGVTCSNLEEFMAALKQRHDFFHALGGRLSDHGVTALPTGSCTREEAEAVYLTARSGLPVTELEIRRFSRFLLLYFGRLDAERDWTKQFHLGAQRNNNSRQLESIGRDAGFDSIGDWRQAEGLARYFDELDRDNCLPKTVIYNLNPADNYVLASMIGNFQDSSVPGKMQFGSGWWFLDQKEGMEWQLNALSNLGLLRRFVGMLTDSRSFLSYSRHEYFRRILCNLLGRDAESGELPRDLDLLGAAVREICFRNARDFFGLEIDARYREA